MKLPKLRKASNKKKILLLCDDIRIHSGVGTMAKSFVINTADRFDWIQVAGAIKHPEKNTWVDASEAIANEAGLPVEDVNVRLFPVEGYGDPNLIRHLIATEKPDAILHFTDPRFWGWLYDMEHEVRQNIPIMYYNIWDDLPYPHWNENAYESCDLLMAISKQTYNINREVCKRKPRVEGIDLTYVQHGIDEKQFYPITDPDGEFDKFRSHILSGREFDFIALFNSRNIHRKRPGDLILAFRKFCDTLPKDSAEKCAIILHTDVVDQHGTNLSELAAALCPNYNVIFSPGKLDTRHMNYLYNITDIVCNPSSAEGFGLSHMEAIMAGTPTIATVLGGLQDQMGFRKHDRYITTDDFTADIPSNSAGRISHEHGIWTYPLWPQSNLQGSPMTPYIYDSRPNIMDIASGLGYWYKMDPVERKGCGLAGRTWAIEQGFTAKGMADAMATSITTCLENFTPRKRYTLIDTDTPAPEYTDGIVI